VRGDDAPGGAGHDGARAVTTPTAAQRPTYESMTDTPSPNTRVIGRYTILRELRRERHSVSYAAVDPVMNRQLVVKAVELLPAGPKLSAEERKRVEQAFVRQAQAAGRLQHPHIVTVFDAGLSHAFGFLVIERVNGRQLHELLAGGLRPAFVQCASIAARIADALECAHGNGVAHGHLGPQHVYLLADGSPKLSGFGGWIDDGASGDEALAGTARLLPYFQNEITEETRQRDVRAIGELLFMMLVGRAPPEAGAAPVAGEPAPSPTLAARPETPPVLARLVDQSLLPGLGNGPKTAAGMRDALTAFIWNERTENVAPNSLGIPLAAPPQRAPVHVATIAPADKAPALAAPAPSQERTLVLSPTRPPEPAAVPVLVRMAPAATVEVDPTAELDALTFLQRLRPWAIRNRLPLVTGGALLSIAIFLGVVLGNLRHPDEAVARTAPAPQAGEVAAASAPREPPVVALVPLALDIHPWGEVFVDGKAAGVAPPLTQVDVAPGRHHVEVRHGDSASWQTDIDVATGATARVAHGFE
jgi:serine/threonine-protein kinase